MSSHSSIDTNMHAHAHSALQVVRSIFIMDHPIAGAEGESAQIIIPFNQVAKAGFAPRKSGESICSLVHVHTYM